MQAYPVALRQRIVEALQEEGASIDSVSERFCVSPSSVKRYKRQFQERGSLAPKPRPGRPSRSNRIRKIRSSSWLPPEQTGVCSVFVMLGTRRPEFRSRLA